MAEDSIRAIRRGIAVLQAINRSGGMTLTDIAVSVGLPYPTVFRVVQCLIEEGMIEREPARKAYRPTALVQTLSSGYQEDSRLVAAARSHIVDLTTKHGWPVTVATHVGYRMMIKDSTHGITSLTFSRYFPGHTLPLLESAVGRAFLAFSSPEDRKSILDTLRARPELADGFALKMFEDDELITIIRTAGYAATGKNRFTRDPGRTSSIAVPLYEGDRIAGSMALIVFSAALRLEDAISRFLPDIFATGAAISKSLTEEGQTRARLIAQDLEP